MNRPSSWPLEYTPLPGHPIRAEPVPAVRRDRGRSAAIVCMAVVAAAVAVVVFVLPRVLLDWDLAGVPAADRAAAVNETRQTLLQGLAGLALLVGAYLTWRQIQVTRQGQITDRFTAAIGQLGTQETEVRIGGVYALERIGTDSALDRQTITEVLSAFVRLHASLPTGTNEWPRPDNETAKLELASKAGANTKLIERTPHVQAAMTVLGRLSRGAGDRPPQLSRADLSYTDLAYADLDNADLHYSDLSRSLLVGTNLCRADLTGAWLPRAVLLGAQLRQADLRHAVLWQARMEHVDLRATDLTNSDLTGAYLTGAHLEQADLRGADLSATNLADAHLSGAFADDTTTWPAGFRPDDAGIDFSTDAPPLRPLNYFP
jgi:uncharacterized protein YjbI with pentapeptide repeats